MVTISNKRFNFNFKFSLRWLTLLTYVFLSILPLLFFYTTVSSLLENELIEQRRKHYSLQVNRTATVISTANYLTDPTKKQWFDMEMNTYSIQGAYRIVVVDNKGVVVSDSGQTDVGKTYSIPEIVEALDGKTGVTLREKNILYATAGIENANSELIGVVLISASVEDIYVLLSDVTKNLSLLLALTIIIVGVLSFFVSQIIIDPLKNVLKIIQKMTEGHLNERIIVTRRNEIGEISDAFNNMAERLEKVDASRQEFVSNVSHELKTPLSSIKVLSESILFQEGIPEETYKEFLIDINSEVDRMTDIINDLLTLVRFDQKEVPLTFKTVSINKLVQDIVKRLIPIAENKNIDLIYEGLKDVSAEVDSTKLTLAVSNLIENGVKYTSAGGSVKVTVSSDHQNVFIYVADSGIGIAEGELSKIFDRFYRVDKTRDRETGGTGLGLSITQKAVLMHKGSIRVTSKESEGTTFIIRIPLHQSQE